MFSKFLPATFLILLLVTAGTQAGSVYKCKQADGSITFTNIACPDDTVNKQYQGEHTMRQSWENNSGRYSVTRQLQNMEQKRTVGQYERNANQQHAVIGRQNRDAQKAWAAQEGKANDYYEKAANIRRESSFRRHMSKSKRKAMEDEAQGLERLGDAISGRRATAAKTDSELSRERDAEANLRADQYRQDTDRARSEIQDLENEAIRMRQHENQRQVERNLFGRNMW